MSITNFLVALVIMLVLLILYLLYLIANMVLSFITLICNLVHRITFKVKS